jgi:hypothetical protein
VLANPPKKLNLRHRLDSQAPFVRMLWQPFSTFCSAGILPAAFARRPRRLSSRGRRGDRGICFWSFCSAGILPAFRSPEAFFWSNVSNLSTCAKCLRNSRRISTSIFRDLKLIRINTYRKMIVCIPPLWSRRCFCGSPSGRFIRRPSESWHIAPRLARLRPGPREAVITRSPLPRAKVLAANVMVRSFAAPAKSSGAFARQQGGPRDPLFGLLPAISLESALAKNRAVTHVQSALPKQRSLTLLK